jgi:hypothetical protein
MIYNFINNKIKFFLLLILLLNISSNLHAFNLEKAIGVVDAVTTNDKKGSNIVNNTVNKPLDKLEQKASKKIDKLLLKIEGSIDKATSKIEQRIDKYDQKIAKIENTSNKIIDLYNKIDPNIFIKNIKNAIIIMSIFCSLLIILFLIVLINLIRVNKKLSKINV